MSAMAALFANPHTAAGQARIIENDNKAFLLASQPVQILLGLF